LIFINITRRNIILGEMTTLFHFIEYITVGNYKENDDSINFSKPAET
jgi:hypothetical protein